MPHRALRQRAAELVDKVGAVGRPGAAELCIRKTAPRARRSVGVRENCYVLMISIGGGLISNSLTGEGQGRCF